MVPLPYILGLLPIVVPVLVFLFIAMRDNATARMQDVVRHEVMRSLSVAHSTIFLLVQSFRLIGIETGWLLEEFRMKESDEIFSHEGYLLTVQQTARRVSPSDERVMTHDRSGMLRNLLAEHRQTPTSEQAQLAWSATRAAAVLCEACVRGKASAQQLLCRLSVNVEWCLCVCISDELVAFQVYMQIR